MQLYTSTHTWYSGPHCPCESGILFFQRQVLTDGLSLRFNNSACENWIGQFPPLWVLKDGWFSLPGCFVAVSFLFHIIFIYFFIDFCQTDYLKIDLRQIFRFDRTMAVVDQPEISFSIPQGTLPWQPIFVGFINEARDNWIKFSNFA